LSYQHANDGDEGDDLGEPPEGKEEAAQHFGDGIAVKLYANANWRLSTIRLQSLGFGCSAFLMSMRRWERIGRRVAATWSPSWRAQMAGGQVEARDDNRRIRSDKRVVYEKRDMKLRR
jgi:hypothetical protein